jgi:hypothetical protein
LSRLRSRFVNVRLTQMNSVDLARFEFDYDTTWTAFLLDAELNIYSRYGGRDENVADSRMSKSSLLQTMQEVLDLHLQLKGRQDLAAEFLHPSPPQKSPPEAIPLLRQNHEGCVHCHQVREYRLLQAAHDGVFERRQLFPFPLPESLGIKFDRGHGHRISAIVPDSPAADARLAPQDTVTRINDVPIHSEYDVRWALERAADDKPLLITIERPQSGPTAEKIQVRLQPRGAWRQTELGWRKSLRSVPFPLGMLGYALGREERKTAGLPEGRLAVKVLSVRGAGLARNLQLEKGDLIIAVAGRDRERTFDEFKSDLLRLYGPGDEVELTVLHNGETRQIRGLFPAWHTTETSVP